MCRSSLVWLPQRGIGWYPVRRRQSEYFDHYDALKDTPIARKLNDFRVRFVNRHHQGAVLDIGIGNGAFIAARRAASENHVGRCGTFGYDIDPKAVAWLEQNWCFEDPFGASADSWPAMTFWDSLEHIEQPDLYFQRCRQWVFVSIPIFDSPQAILHSKHFKPTEHCWYFTRDGLIRFMERFGFPCVEETDQETRIGRQGIMSFAFKRQEVRTCASQY